MIVKFRERWEKLKESAKRKKEAKAAATAMTNAASGAVQGGKENVKPDEDEELAEVQEATAM
jgi:hypothetical protein